MSLSDTLGSSYSEVMSLIQVSQLTPYEIQTLTDELLSKQGVGQEWTKVCLLSNKSQCTATGAFVKVNQYWLSGVNTGMYRINIGTNMDV